LGIKFTHDQRVRHFVEILLVCFHMEHLHLVEKFVAVAEVKILFKKILTFELVRVFTPFISDLQMLSQFHSCFLEHAHFKT